MLRPLTIGDALERDRAGAEHAEPPTGADAPDTECAFVGRDSPRADTLDDEFGR